MHLGDWLPLELVRDAGMLWGWLQSEQEGSESFEGVKSVIEHVAVAIEVLAVVIIVVAIVVATARYLLNRLRGDDSGYHAYRYTLGAGLLLGLEVLVAADVIRTVALEPTLENVGVLGLLVTIRIALGWSLVVEIEQRWPWQREQAE